MFQLDLKSRKSIYEQVMDNLKELIMTGTLSAGEKLPSVRDLSKQITV
ncbi:MAG: GntR family transcriptional regulator, partial [Firmicutes bacterium]|nr:GntR family transcriptional regulator [Bacillota bacterium]